MYSRVNNALLNLMVLIPLVKRIKSLFSASFLRSLPHLYVESTSKTILKSGKKKSAIYCSTGCWKTYFKLNVLRYFSNSISCGRGFDLKCLAIDFDILERVFLFLDGLFLFIRSLCRAYISCVSFVKPCAQWFSPLKADKSLASFIPLKFNPNFSHCFWKASRPTPLSWLNESKDLFCSKCNLLITSANGILKYNSIFSNLFIFTPTLIIIAEAN